jgi:hypothetical protein
VGSAWESPDLKDCCVVYSPVNITSLGKSSSDITSSI